MKVTTLLIIITLLNACASQLSQPGRMVRAINADSNTHCKFTGALIIKDRTLYFDYAEAETGLINKVRNTVAEHGSDAFVVVSASIEAGTAHIDSYRCTQ